MRTRRAPGRVALGALPGVLVALLCLVVALAALRGDDNVVAGSCEGGAVAATGAHGSMAGTVVAASHGHRTSARLRAVAAPALIPCSPWGPTELSHPVTCPSCPTWIVLAAWSASERSPPA
jgi:hypothetical protein